MRVLCSEVNWRSNTPLRQHPFTSDLNTAITVSKAHTSTPDVGTITSLLTSDEIFCQQNLIQALCS